MFAAPASAGPTIVLSSASVPLTSESSPHARIHSQRILGVHDRASELDHPRVAPRRARYKPSIRLTTSRARANGPRQYLSSGYQGTLGLSYPAALGAKVAQPERAVVALAGDGGFMYNLQELATAAQYNIPVVALVFNDNSYGNVRRIQREHYGNRVIASDLTNPDFVRLAESFGLAGVRADDPDDLRRALERALARNEPALIEVKVGEMPGPWSHIILPRVRG